MITTTNSESYLNYHESQTCHLPSFKEKSITIIFGMEQFNPHLPWEISKLFTQPFKEEKLIFHCAVSFPQMQHCKPITTTNIQMTFIHQFKLLLPCYFHRVKSSSFPPYFKCKWKFYSEFSQELPLYQTLCRCFLEYCNQMKSQSLKCFY